MDFRRIRIIAAWKKTFYEREAKDKRGEKGNGQNSEEEGKHGREWEWEKEATESNLHENNRLHNSNSLYKLSNSATLLSIQQHFMAAERIIKDIKNIKNISKRQTTKMG